MTSPDWPIDPLSRRLAGPGHKASDVGFPFDIASLNTLRSTVAAHAGRMDAAGMSGPSRIANASRRSRPSPVPGRRGRGEQIDGLAGERSRSGGPVGPFHPEPGGLLPFGRLGDGYLCWPRCNSDPDQWVVVLTGPPFAMTAAHQMSASLALWMLAVAPEKVPFLRGPVQQADGD